MLTFVPACASSLSDITALFSKSVLKRYRDYQRMETEKTRYKNEKISNRLLVKCYKNTYKYLKKHKKDIIKYGDILFEKGYLVASDFNV